MPDVLVAGGGPTGPATAFELERAGLDVLVPERDARPTMHVVACLSYAIDGSNSDHAGPTSRRVS